LASPIGFDVAHEFLVSIKVGFHSSNFQTRQFRIPIHDVRENESSTQSVRWRKRTFLPQLRVVAKVYRACERPQAWMPSKGQEYIQESIHKVISSVSLPVLVDTLQCH